MSRFLGEVRQVGYVVRDVEAARNWDGTEPIRRMDAQTKPATASGG
ncbi:MAG TPA: hypothetical protein VF449_03355 [Parvibaculum sp.]